MTNVITEDGLFNKIVTAAIIGLLGWLIVTVQQVSVQQATATTEIVNLKELVVTMRTDFITRAEADIRLNSVEGEMQRLRDRLRIVETRDELSIVPQP